MVEYKSLREISTNILERKIKPQGVYRKMKGCILKVNFGGEGWWSRLFTIMLILNWNLRYPQKRGVNIKKGEVLEVVLPRKGPNDLPCGRKSLPGDNM